MSHLALGAPSESAGRSLRNAFWLRWVAANAVAELVGLGSSMLLWGLFIFREESRLGVVWAALLVVLGSTALEGTAVGVAQWAVLRARLPRLPLSHWWLATAVGAAVAWTAGMIPSTLMSLESAESTSAAAPPSDAMMLVLAAAMGFVLGVVLAWPQWWVLRRHVARAGWWLPANMLAWAGGMAVIFAVVGAVVGDGPFTPVAAIMLLAGLALAGAVVGAVHGAVLVRLLRAPQPAGALA